MIRIRLACTLSGSKFQTQKYKENGIASSKGKCPVCGFSAAVWVSGLIDNPEPYDATCPECKTELLIYRVRREIYLREKSTYF